VDAFYQSIYDYDLLRGDGVIAVIGRFILDNLHWMILTLVVHFLVLGAVAYIILLERKTASWVQDRLGPNRVGFSFGLDFMPKFHFWGLGQPLADGLKFIMKEDYNAKNVDKILFTLAPMMMVITVIISIAVIPWGGVKGEREVVDVTVVAERAQQAGLPVGPAVAAAIEASPEFRRGNDVIGDIDLYQIGSGAARTGIEAALVAEIGGGATPVTRLNGVGAVQPGQTLQPLAENTRLVASFTQGWHFQIANINIGVLFILAALSLAVYGVVVGGWASNNKYSFLGGLRATANMISYEIPLGISVLVLVICFSTLDLARIVDLQANYWLGVIPAWNVFAFPLAFLLFLVCIHAEANRAPFDMAEAEQELVGGYHTEYSSMRFAIFFLAEYAGMVTTSALCVALFFGGWHIPWIDLIFPVFGGAVDPESRMVTDNILINLLRFGVFFVKTILVLFIFIWVRWSLPRFRFDQVMHIAWKAMIPISLILVVATTVVVVASGGNTADGLNFAEAAALLLANVVTLGVSMVGAKLLPTGPSTNDRINVPNRRLTPLPRGLRALSGQPATA
jgi:NADH:ubiquinone oxidoreductase subunit H